MRINLFFVIPVLLFGAHHGHSQSLNWAVPVNLGAPQNGSFVGQDIAVNEYGEPAVVGPSDSLINYTEWYGKLKYQLFSTQGTVLYSETWGGNGLVKDMVAHDNHFYIVGKYLDSLRFTGQPLLSTFGPNNRVGSYIAKIHRTGTVQWALDVSTIAPLMIAECLAVDSAGTLFLGIGLFGADSKIVQLDGNGVVLDTWTQTGVPVISSISVNDNGLVSIAGSCTSSVLDFNGTSVAWNGSYNFYAAGYDAVGTLQWHHFLDDVTCSFPVVLIDENNHTYVAGDANITTTLGTLPIAPLGWVYSFFLGRVDPVGNAEWVFQPSIDTSGIIGDAAIAPQHALVQFNSDVVLAGHTRGDLDWGNGVLSSSAIPGEDFFMARLNDQGLTQNMIMSGNSSFLQRTISIAAGLNNNLYMIGFGYDTLQIQGVTIPASGYSMFLSRWSGVTQNVPESDRNEWQHYPNPTTDALQIPQLERNDHVRIMDLSGKLVQQEVVSNSKRISVQRLNNGTYLLQVSRGSLTAYRSRFMITR